MKTLRAQEHDKFAGILLQRIGSVKGKSENCEVDVSTFRTALAAFVFLAAGEEHACAQEFPDVDGARMPRGLVGPPGFVPNVWDRDLRITSPLRYRCPPAFHRVYPEETLVLRVGG